MFDNIEVNDIYGETHWVCWFDDDTYDELGTSIAFVGYFADGMIDSGTGVELFGD